MAGYDQRGVSIGARVSLLRAVRSVTTVPGGRYDSGEMVDEKNFVSSSFFHPTYINNTLSCSDGEACELTNRCGTSMFSFDMFSPHRKKVTQEKE